MSLAPHPLENLISYPFFQSQNPFFKPLNVVLKNLTVFLPNIPNFGIWKKFSQCKLKIFYESLEIKHIFKSFTNSNNK